MNSRFFNIVFVGIFCLGVTCSSPVAQNVQSATVIPLKSNATADSPPVGENSSNQTVSVPDPGVTEAVVVAETNTTAVNGSISGNGTDVKSNTNVKANETIVETVKGKSTIGIELHNNTSTANPNTTTPLTPATTTTTTNTTTTTTTTTTTPSTSKTSTPATPATIPTTNATSPATPSDKSTTTITTVISSSTPSISAHDRQFDGPSFFGGIILTVGLTAIGFVAFKFYKANKSDGNYRTL